MNLHRRAIRIVRARLGLVSNNGELLTRSEYFTDPVPQSLLTDYHRIDDVPWDGASAGVDAEIRIIDTPGLDPAIVLEPDRVVAVGDWTALEAANSDRRYSLFGNLGFLFRYAIHALERYHDTWSFHASAMVDDKGDLWLVPGGAGAGKTVFLLEGLSRGWTIFSTEMTHVRLTDGGYEFYKGSLFDNIRLGTLLYDFPGVIERLGLTLPSSPSPKDPWGSKIALDLGHVQTPADLLVRPALRIVSPKVESGRERAVVADLGRREKLVKLLFDNATEKHGGTVLLYDRLPVPSLDTPALMARRLRAMQGLVERAAVKSARSTLCGARNCLEGLLDE
ncbi:MAG TPA: hypothetical protein VHF87_05420 [Methylomirabilota bacterium]|jgi:hypothetical protein|nr:hypothetical protein [Methylomirabilota bacterium]